jgi:2-phosphoglycolate phosphatase
MIAVAAMLFDLDGTLLDTAPDMVAALNQLRSEQRTDPLPYQLARAHVSNGALGLLRIGFPGMTPVAGDRLHCRYLELYAERLIDQSALFGGMSAVLDALDAARLPWGVVTNKPRQFTEPLLSALRLLERAACVVSGDSLPERKPHPRPLLFALERLGVSAREAVYVGDAPRDIEAGRAAGMGTVAARYGYIEPEEDPARWGADHVIDHPEELLMLLATPGPQ